MKKTITLNSPAGSGNTFCGYLMQYNLEIDLNFIQHDVNFFDKDGLNLCILRNPYQTVASAVEIHFDFMEKSLQDIFLKHPDYFINKSIEHQIMVYDNFLYNSKKFEYITAVDFEFLTEEPYQFLTDISKKFDLQFKKNRLSVEKVKYKMKSEVDMEHRLPREHSEFRNLITEAVNNHKKIKNSYDKYLEYKNSFDLKYVGKSLK